MGNQLAPAGHKTEAEGDGSSHLQDFSREERLLPGPRTPLHGLICAHRNRVDGHGQEPASPPQEGAGNCEGPPDMQAGSA